jgi:hypothetical protein
MQKNKYLPGMSDRAKKKLYCKAAQLFIKNIKKSSTLDYTGHSNSRKIEQNSLGWH